MGLLKAIFNFFKWTLILTLTLFGLVIAAGIVAVYYEDYLKEEVMNINQQSASQEEEVVKEEDFILKNTESNKENEDKSLETSKEQASPQKSRPPAPPDEDARSRLDKSEKSSTRSDAKKEESLAPPPPRFSPLKGQTVFKSDAEPPWYHFRFSYQDIIENLYMWEWLLRQADVDRSLNAYGLPRDFFQNYYDKEKTDVILKKGFFRYDKDGYICTDYNAVLNYYHRFTEPLYVILKNKVGAEAPLTDYIEELLRFCQDIPYKRPGDYYKGKYIWDFYTPVHIMLEREGDCDSKSVLFASVLMHDRRFRDKIVYITVSGHLLLGIEGEPNPYQDWVEFQGKKYIVCDPVGPAHTAFGVSAWDYGPVLNIEKASLY
jgi:hypothetical protein